MKHLTRITLFFLIVFISFSCLDNNYIDDNKPPVCEVTSPEYGTKFNRGDTIILNYSYSDPDGTIEEVDIVWGDMQIENPEPGTTTSFIATDNVLFGSHLIKVYVYDDKFKSGVDSTRVEIARLASPETVTDIDGNVYNVIQIGYQCWMQENLAVTHYPNGEEIPYVTENQNWALLADNDTDDAFCYFNNEDNGNGALYTFAAAIADDWAKDNASGQGICPDGWHLPDYEEWVELSEYLIANEYNWDGTTTENKIGKSMASTYGWSIDNISGHVGNDQAGNNASGFTGLPTGYRVTEMSSFENASFQLDGQWGIWWGITPQSGYSQGISLKYNEQSLISSSESKSAGISVRCIWDKSGQ